MSGWLTAASVDVREHFVYRAFGADGSLLYVGRTKNPGKRLSQHKRQGAAWVPLAARFRVTGPLTYPVAADLERDLIVTAQPAYNRRGLAGGRDYRSGRVA